MIKLELLLEDVNEQKLIQYIHSLTKSQLEDIAWNYTMLQSDEDMVEGLKFIKEEVKYLPKNK